MLPLVAGGAPPHLSLCALQLRPSEEGKRTAIEWVWPSPEQEKQQRVSSLWCASIRRFENLIAHCLQVEQRAAIHRTRFGAARAAPVFSFAFSVMAALRWILFCLFAFHFALVRPSDREKRNYDDSSKKVYMVGKPTSSTCLAVS